MESKTLTNLFIVMFIAMFIGLFVVAGIGVYKWTTSPVYVPIPTTPTASADPAEVAKNQLECLAYNVFHEARGEPQSGQEAVAWVTLNRVESKRYPGNICDVVKQPKQFSWYKGSTSLAINWKDPIEVKAWNKAKKIAERVIADFVADKNDPTKGALFYHANYVNPKWAAEDNIVATVGNHVFYKQDVVIANR